MDNRKGFTLIEIVLSFALIGIIAVSLLTIFNSGLLNIVRAGNRTEAVNIAEDIFVTIPTIQEEKSYNVTLVTDGGTGTVTHTISGSIAKGTGIVNNAEVDIQVFVPGLFKD